MEFKIRVILIATLFLFKLNNLSCQLRLSYGEPFDSIYQIAEDAKIAENYEFSSQKFNEAYAVNGNKFPVIIFSQYAFLASYYGGDIDKAVSYLSEYVSLNILSDDEIELLLNHEKFKLLRPDEKWPEILDVAKKKRNQFAKIYRLLEEIEVNDQSLRLLLDCSAEVFTNQKQHDYLHGQIKRQDSINLTMVENIIDDYGWLGIYNVGEAGNSTLWKVILHADLDTQEKYIPLIQQSADNGETSPNKLAFLEDRMRLYRGQYQIYGTQVVKDNDGKYRVYPIENPSEVNARRARLGFEPLKEYLQFFDIIIESEHDLQLDYLLEKWSKKN